MRNVPLPSFINKPHQEKGKTGKFFKKIKGKIKDVGGKIKEGTQLIGDRLKEGVANTKDVLSDLDASEKVQEIREENQNNKELESLAGIYGETTNVPPQDVINLANWGRFTPETDTLINVNQHTTHQSHAVRQMLRNQGGGAFSGSLSMQDVGGKGSDLSNYSSGTRNLIFDKEKYLDTVKPNKRKTKK